MLLLLLSSSAPGKTAVPSPCNSPSSANTTTTAKLPTVAFSLLHAEPVPQAAAAAAVRGLTVLLGCSGLATTRRLIRGLVQRFVRELGGPVGA